MFAVTMRRIFPSAEELAAYRSWVLERWDDIEIYYVADIFYEKRISRCIYEKPALPWSPDYTIAREHLFKNEDDAVYFKLRFS